MNVKTVASMLGRSQTTIIQRALKVNVGHTKGGQWYFTERDVESIRSYRSMERLSILREIVKECGITESSVRRLACEHHLRFRTDKDRIMFLCKAWKTGLYTSKGLQYVLENYPKPFFT